MAKFAVLVKHPYISGRNTYYGLYRRRLWAEQVRADEEALGHQAMVISIASERTRQWRNEKDAAAKKRV